VFGTHSYSNKTRDLAILFSSRKEEEIIADYLNINHICVVPINDLHE
jgi:hypothetical protein